jgi:hypothetical protein
MNERMRVAAIAEQTFGACSQLHLALFEERSSAGHRSEPGCR